ncbi:glycosyltransferase family 2 protein [Aeromonas veronii]|uniref:glycosyltransferase family 2 protein n=1 Tax=Aeromonas veronii TaxID=654 RepID=UPI003005A8FD
MCKISIAVVTYNRAEKLERALKSCFAQIKYVDEIIIVDNASDDHTHYKTNEISIGAPIPIKLIKTHRNIGCPRARNLAIANCKNRFVYCLDDDGWLDSSTISSSLNLIGDGVSVVVSRIVEPVSEFDMGLSGYKRDVGKFSGGASLIDKEDFLVLGGFPDFFRQMEESYVSLKLLDMGKRIVFNPESKMFHEKIKNARQTKDEIRYNFLNEMKVLDSLFNVFLFLFFLLPIKSMSHARIYWSSNCFNYFIRDFVSSFLLPFTIPLELSTPRKKIPFKLFWKQKKLT